MIATTNAKLPHIIITRPPHVRCRPEIIRHIDCPTCQQPATSSVFGKARCCRCGWSEGSKIRTLA